MAFEEFRTKKDKLLKAYEIIKSNSNFSNSLSDIDNQIVDLTNQKFFVSFTGQIKSGKSTLLNALIFGDQVLPVDDTPYTEKITHISYGEKPNFKAYFYNQKEWENLKNHRCDDKENYFEKYIAPKIEYSFEKSGVYEAEVITEKGLVETSTDMSFLKEYIACNGTYTPFVKECSIYYPSELLKDLVFVDTPGTNDPDPYRSQITKDWIGRAKANIFVTYAKRAFDDSDISFIDEYLLHIPSAHRLIAVNKIDTVSDEEDLEAWIDEVSSNQKFQRRGIFTDKNKIFRVSGLGALIDKMLQKKINLSQNFEYHADKLDEKGYLDPDRHGIEGLLDAICRTLMQNTAELLLVAHREFILKLFEKSLRQINIQREELTQKKLLNIEKKEVLEKKRAEISATKKFISNRFQYFQENDIASIRSKLDHELPYKMKSIKDQIIDIIEANIKQINNIYRYENEVLWIIKHTIEDYDQMIWETANEAATGLAKDLISSVERFKEDLQVDSILSEELMQLTFQVHFSNLLYQLKIFANNQFGSEVIADLVKENTNFLQRWFNTRGGREKVESIVMSKAKAYIGDSFDVKVIRPAIEEINSQLRNIFEKIETDIATKVENLSTELEKAIDDKNNRKQAIEDIEMKSAELEDRKIQITSLQNEIDQFVI